MGLLRSCTFACLVARAWSAESCVAASGCPIEERGDAAALLQVTPRCPPVTATNLQNITGFEGPESVVWDKKRHEFYVSNVNGALGLTAKGTAKGYISKMSHPAGNSNVDLKWVTGLDAPLGLAVYGDLLYVADVDMLRVIDITKAMVVKTYTADGVRLLNGVAVDCHGKVYVSDFFGDRIWRLEGDDFQIWLHNADLNGPNGVKVVKDKLIVASWGANPIDEANGFDPQGPGALLKVDIRTRHISSVSELEDGDSLDGVVPLGRDGYLVTNYFKGLLQHVKAIDKPGGIERSIETVAVLQPTVADLAYVAGQGLACVPVTGQNYVAVFHIAGGHLGEQGAEE